VLPFGTILLGIFTLIVLSRLSAKAFFFPAANEKTAEIKSA
jgi:hypothetical protein